ncbi:hypothetical protein FQN54_003066 [Arachnomyces sp. PD_36]|nr:hypothetical protein FQN54_003066 [Arachnomyces sp. PD_36]
MAPLFLEPEEIMLPPSPPEPSESPTNGTPNKLEKKLEEITITLPFPPSTTPAQPRSNAPFSRTHIRSRSSAGVLGSPQMTRAHSSPGLDSRGRYVFANSPVRPSSPMGQSGRRRSPLRTVSDESTFTNSSALNISETISENAELETFPKPTTPDYDLSSTSPTMPSMIHHTFPRSVRRRPSSPLHQTAMGINMGVGSNGSYTSSPTSSHSSPLIVPAKYNESYPSSSLSSTSSMPSTPTSTRSRSPSISSLETIPDIPDAEAEEIELDRIAKLKAAAEKAESNANNDTSRRRGTLDVPGSSNSLSSASRPGFSTYGGGRGDKRKRWSVCGAERRQDLDLETIWED